MHIYLSCLRSINLVPPSENVKICLLHNFGMSMQTEVKMIGTAYTNWGFDNNRVGCRVYGPTIYVNIDTGVIE